MTWNWGFPDWRGVWFPAVYAAAAAVLAGGWTAARGRPSPMVVAALLVAAAVALTNVTLFWSQPVRDLELYLRAGERWIAGDAVYSHTPLTHRPEDLADYPFLYPPITLPLFAGLSAIGLPAATAVWGALSTLAVVGGARLLGLRWPWPLLLLAWPPVAQGLYVGNVAVPLFFLFAAAPWRAAGLLAGPLFKPQVGLAALWLLRREQWPELLRGVLLLAALAALTLPVIDPRLWGDWLLGLRTYQVSQGSLPEYLYGFGLGRYLPEFVPLLLGGLVVLLAISARDRLEQLLRLGIAAIVASPSLFTHGFLLALPALSRLDTRWLWIVLAITSTAPGAAWFLAIGVLLASWFMPSLRKRPGHDPLHPLGSSTAAWPTAPAGRPRAGEATGR